MMEWVIRLNMNYGAIEALNNSSYMSRNVRRIEYVELTTRRQFQDKFVAFLNTSHSQDFLSQVEFG